MQNVRQLQSFFFFFAFLRNGKKHTSLQRSHCHADVYFTARTLEEVLYNSSGCTGNSPPKCVVFLLQNGRGRIKKFGTTCKVHREGGKKTS